MDTKLYGQRVNRNGWDMILLAEASVSEGILLPSGYDLPVRENVFNRPVRKLENTSFSALAAMGLTGLRAGACLRGESLLAWLTEIKEACRNRLPMAIHLAPGTGESFPALPEGLEVLAGYDVPVLVSANPAEAFDMALIAHHLSEMALLPVLHLMLFDPEAMVSEGDIPARKKIAAFSGQPEDYLDTPTAAQEMLFGPKRRRVPAWLNPDLPVRVGSRKDREAGDRAWLASREFLNRSLADMVRKSFDAFNKAFDWAYHALEIPGHKPQPNRLIAMGCLAERAAETAASLREEKSNVSAAALRVLHPFPQEEVQKFLNRARTVTILSPAGQAGAAFWRSHLPAAETVCLGFCPGNVGDNALRAAFLNMLEKAPKKYFYTGFNLGLGKSPYPKQEILLQRLRREFPELTELSLPDADPRPEAPGPDPEVPLAVRQYLDHGPPWSRLSAFYDHTGIFYRKAENSRLTTDPFKALTVTPPVTAAFSGVEQKREKFPRFDAAKCTGCASCFMFCPYASIGPVAFGLEKLVRAGMDMASVKGVTITRLIPAVKNLAKVAGVMLKKSDELPANMGGFLPQAFEELAVQMKWEGERLEQVRSEFEAVLREIASLPVAVTETFFRNPEQLEKGSGELFSLVIDPFTCSGCGLCASVCPEDALEMQDQEAGMMSEASELLRIWESLPDTGSKTIQRLIHHPEYPSLGALMLSKSFLTSMHGSGGSHEGVGVRTVVRMVLAAAESVLQPKMLEWKETVDKLAKSLSRKVHDDLSKALPEEDFEDLSRALSAVRSSKVPFEDLMARFAQREHKTLVDSVALQRMIRLISQLKDLSWALAQGPTGSGRARMNLVVLSKGALSWAGDWPWNPFTAPVLVKEAGSLAGTAMGILYGLERYVVDNVKLIRRAGLEAAGKYNPEEHDREIAAMSWKDLDEEEKSLLPPVLILADSSCLSGTALEHLETLLASGLPLKMVLFDSAALPAGKEPAATIARQAGQMLSAMALKNVHITQAGPDNPEFLYLSLVEALRDGLPAWLTLCAPDPLAHRDRDTKWPDLATLAVATRAFTVFRFDPDADSLFFSECLSLDYNPDAEKNWTGQTLSYLEEGEEKSLDIRLTWADWAFTLKAWENHFTPYEPDNGKALPVAEYLETDPGQREGVIPVIYRVENGELQTWAVSPEVVQTAETVQTIWHSLREWAGMLTPYPEKLRKEVEKELSEKYKADLQAARAEFEQRLKEQEQAQLEQIRRKLRDKLVALARQGELKNGKKEA